jgi:hypothetical protein
MQPRVLRRGACRRRRPAGTRRQADSPHVPAQRPGIEDIREMQDPYDLPFPDYSDHQSPDLPVDL